MLSHNNLVANTVQCRHWMPTLRDGEEVFLGVVPFFHVYGLSTCMNLGILTGSCIVLLPRFKTDDVLHTIVRHQVTIFMGVQAMYVAINNYSRINQFDLSSIRICISGAGPLHAEVQDRFEELTGGKLVEGYGLSEASPVTHCTPINGRRKKGSIGLPFPDTDAKIMDQETGQRELSVGERGELVIRGPQVMKGYWNKEEETKGVLRDGWLYTGDMAQIDEDGYFYIVDRKKDMIKTRGENVYPREVEEVLFRHPKIKEAVVVGIPDTFSVEAIKAYIVVKEHEHATEAEILDYCRKELAKFKVPSRIEFRKELPKTMVGKVLRRVLLEEELRKKESEVPR
jgi:long-chain acyl-CoA synthetase